MRLLSLVLAFSVVVVPPGYAKSRAAQQHALSLFDVTSPDASYVNSLTTAPDGSVWFSSAWSIGSIDGHGIVAVDQRCYSLVAARDGALWCTTGSALRRIAGGEVVEFPVAPDSEIHSLTATLDGRIAFVDRGRQLVGWITADGARTEVPISSAGAPLVTGADGSLWFLGPPSLVQIDSAGVVHTYDASEALAGHAYPGFSSMTVTEDNTVWLGVASDVKGGVAGGAIVKMTTDGRLTRVVSLPMFYSPIRLAPASGGSVVAVIKLDPFYYSYPGFIGVLHIDANDRAHEYAVPLPYLCGNPGFGGFTIDSSDRVVVAVNCADDVSVVRLRLP